MILYPAIDISEGKAVRLVQGDFESSKVGNKWFGSEFDHPARRAQHVGETRLERTQVDSVRVCDQVVERHVVWAGSQHDAPRLGLSRSPHRLETRIHESIHLLPRLPRAVDPTMRLQVRHLAA